MTPPPDRSRWIRKFHPGPAGAPELVCFPHAGGSASYFFGVSEALRTTAEVAAVQYPGRQDRSLEACLTAVSDLADETMETLLPQLNGPVALFGHSLGASVAFEVAIRMQRRGIGPSALFVSGRRAPTVRRPETVHLGSDEEIVAELKALNGTNAELLDDPGVLRMVMTSVRSDFRAAETYEFRGGPMLDCPVVAMVGDADPRVAVDEVRPWAERTTGRFALRVFSGGHFYLDEHRAAVLNILREMLERRAPQSRTPVPPPAR